MKILKLIIQREFIAKVRNKSFIVMTFLSPILFIAIALVVGYLSSIKADQKTIAIHDDSNAFRKEFKSNPEYKYIDLSAVDMRILRDSIVNESYQGLIFIPNSQDINILENNILYISNESPSVSQINNLQEIIQNKITKNRFKTAKIDTIQILKNPPKVNISLIKANGKESLKGINEIKIIIGGAFGYLIMMFIIIYGNMVMRSVIEEKTNRIIEIIVSSVKPFQLMMGKIIGTSLAGILQFAIWAILGLLFMIIASFFFGVNASPTANIPPELLQTAQSELILNAKMYLNEIWSLPIATILVSFLIYFVGGYFLYSSFYAAIGAAVDSETDSQQFLLPIIMPLILGVYIGFFTVVNDPHGSIAMFFSFFPLTSPIVMMMRIPFGVPWWQVLISISILFATFFLVVWFASKIYRIGILMYGKKPTWRELYKWIKY
jgi:ABC-2 type transport system permease protein